jgi:hypothetical protein
MHSKWMNIIDEKMCNMKNKLIVNSIQITMNFIQKTFKII